MREVYESRATFIEKQRRQIHSDKGAVFQEREIIEDEVAQDLAKMEDEKLRKRIIRERMQGDVLTQVAEREKHQKRKYVEDMYEQRAKFLAEQEYNKKIQQELAVNAEKLQHMRSTGFR